MNFLVDLIPEKARKYLYGALTFLSTVYAIWVASNGDWVQFSVSLVTALVTALATANTKPKETPQT